MNKISLIMIAIIMFVFSCSEIPKPIPGGVLTIDSPWNTAPYDALVIFDPDTIVNNGNELIIPISLDQYRNTDNTVFSQFSWSSEGVDIPEGSYYVYSTFDFDRNDDLNGTDMDFVYVWAPSSYTNLYSFNDVSGEIETSAGVLVPNYRVSSSFCAEASFLMQIAF